VPSDFSPSAKRSGIGFFIGLALAICIATTLIILATNWGLATSSDSARYVRTARHMLSDTPDVDAGEPKHEQAHYPPFYPMVLAGWGKLAGTDPRIAARWLHVLIFTASVLLCGLIVRRFGAAEWAAIMAALMVAIAPVSIFIHSWLLSEPLFILLSLLAFYMLMRHLDRPGWGWLVGSAIAASLGTMTRYAGAAIAPAIVLALLLLAMRRSWRKRIGDAIVFSVLFLILPIGNAVHNLRLEGSATNRELAFHPISMDHVKEAIATLASYASPLGVSSTREAANAHVLLAIAGLILFAGVFIIGCGVAWQKRRSNLGKLAGAMALYIACFGTLLVFSISFVDFHTPADQRVLSPIFVTWVILGACGATAIAEPLRRGVRAGFIAGCGAAICLIGSPSIRLVARLHRHGDGFSHAMWQQSPTLAAVRELPPDMEVFTNAPGVVYLLTGRELILTVPSSISASSMLPNPDYQPLMTRIRDEMDAGRGVLVYLKHYGAHRLNYPSEQDLRSELHLHLRQRFPDGAIFDRAQGSGVQK
jgi:4-amino-4-deoxy-L-arabinose transferase-like glycosyltransferase